MTPSPLPVFSVEEYLSYDGERPDKHEFVDGCIVSMAGASPPHARIAYNLSVAMGQRCHGFSSDLRVCIEQQTMWVYPDLAIVCGEAQWAETNPRTLVNPTFLVEILSPSTALYDRNLKAPRYKECPSVREFLLVGQKPVQVEHWMRCAADEWRVELITNDAAVLRIECARVEIPVSEIYSGVEGL